MAKKKKRKVREVLKKFEDVADVKVLFFKPIYKMKKRKKISIFKEDPIIGKSYHIDVNGVPILPDKGGREYVMERAVKVAEKILPKMRKNKRIIITPQRRMLLFKDNPVADAVKEFNSERRKAPVLVRRNGTLIRGELPGIGTSKRKMENALLSPKEEYLTKDGKITIHKVLAKRREVEKPVVTGVVVHD